MKLRIDGIDKWPFVDGGWSSSDMSMETPSTRWKNSAAVRLACEQAIDRRSRQVNSRWGQSKLEKTTQLACGKIYYLKAVARPVAEPSTLRKRLDATMECHRKIVFFGQYGAI